MCKFSAFLFVVFLHTTGVAQYIPIDSSLVKMKKNIVSTYINPALALMMGGNLNEAKFGIIYKRQIAENKRIRVQASYTDFLTYRDDLYTTNFIGWTDSSGFYLSQSDVEDFEIHGAVGFEWGNYTKSIAPYYSADLLIGYGRSSSYQDWIVTHRDSSDLLVHTSPSDSVLLAQPGGATRFQNDLSNIQKSFQIGAVFTVGCRFNIKSRFELCTQLSPSINFVQNRNTLHDYVNNRDYSRDSNGINFNLRLLEVLLSYKF